MFKKTDGGEIIVRCEEISFGTGGCAYFIYLPWKVGRNSEENKCVSVDKCLLPEIIKLWESGIKTTGCCCGHGKSELSFIGVKTECIEQMKEMGYEVSYNPSRPNDEDSFTPKTELDYEQMDHQAKIG